MTYHTESIRHGRRDTDRPRAARRATKTLNLERKSIARVVLAELELGLAVRVALGILLYILRLRLDAKTLTRERAGELRRGVIELVGKLIAQDPSMTTGLVDAPEPSPSTDASTGPAQTGTNSGRATPREVALWNALRPEGLLIEDINKTSLRDLSVGELRQFTKSACHETRPFFEHALLDAYRRELLSTFCGSFTVKQHSEDHYAPDFLVICRSEKTAVLSKPKPGERPLYAGAYDMLVEHWRHQKRPAQFKIEVRNKSD